ncbi:MAG: restriction endonuclease subunit S [Arcobacteraceae bacterium]|nr:restriction endonuclease subunit S [Arcobacteraceae bacterium]
MSNVPKLRFKEFSGEWEEKKLGDIAEVSSGGTPSRTKQNYWNGKIPWVTTTLIDFKIIDKTEELITEDGLKNSSTKIFPIGTILMAMYGQGKTRGKVGILGIEASTNQACGAIIVNKDKLNSLFLFHNLAKRYDEIRNLSNQGGQENLSGGIIKSIYIPYTTLEEQEKIASFLTSVDTKIEQLTKKEALLQEYKKGVMNKIFNQEIRFKDDDESDFSDWEEKNLGKICKIRTGKLDANAMVEKGKYRFYTCAKDYYLIDNYAFDTDALIISGNGANVGYIHHYKGKFNAYQRTYVLDKFNDNIFYLKYFLDKYLYQRIFTEKKEGNTPYIVLSTLLEMNIFMPCIKEQTKIANFLSSIDKKIELTTKELNSTKEFKKALLQQMFV